MVKVRADRKQEMTHAHTVIIKLVGPATKKGFGKSVPRFLKAIKPGYAAMTAAQHALIHGRRRNADAGAGGDEDGDDPDEDTTPTESGDTDTKAGEEGSADTEATAGDGVHTALKVLFDTLDTNKNGVVEKGEILSVLRNPDTATVELIRGVDALAGLLKPQHYAATLNAMDTNKDGSMQFDELVTFCEKGQHRQAGQMEETKEGKGEAKKKEDEEEKEEEVKVSKLSILTTLRDNHTARKIMAEAGRRDPWARELLDAETYGESILDMQVRIAIVMSYGANIFHAVYLVEKCVLTLNCNILHTAAPIPGSEIFYTNCDILYTAI